MKELPGGVKGNAERSVAIKIYRQGNRWNVRPGEERKGWIKVTLALMDDRHSWALLHPSRG